MSVVRTAPAQSWRALARAEVLSCIRDAELHLAIWERTAIPETRLAVAAFLSAKEAVSLDVPSQKIDEFKDELCSALGESSSALKSSLRALVEDVRRLSAMFMEISGREHLRLRFERVEDDGCALFHVDTLPMRMLCTYAGPGTQWLEDDNVRRDQLGSRGRSIEEANAAICIDPDRIRTAPAWHVLIFKGRLWEGHGFNDGLVHRSAPVRHPADYRLRLTIDFSDSCGC